MADWEAILVRLDVDKESAERELGEARARARELALAAVAGDPAAVAETTELNGRVVSRLQKLDLLEVAGGEAAAELAKAQEREAVVVAEARKAEGREIARELLEQSKLADEAMREAAAALGKRAALAHRLTGFGGNGTALMNRVRLAGAAGAAGLDTQLEVRRTPRQHHSALASTDAKILAALLGEAPPEGPPDDPRFLRGQVGPHTIGRPAAPAVEHDPAVRW